MPDTGSGSSLVSAARANAITHGLAATGMLVWIVPGLPTGELGADERMRWVAAHRVGWTAAWLLWHPAALSLGWLLVRLFREARRRRAHPFRWLWRGSLAALICGIACDLSGQWAFIGSAGVHGISVERFDALQVWGSQLTGLAANGLYTVAFAGAAISFWQAWPPALRRLASVCIAAGALLSGATWLDTPLGQMIGTGVLMPAVVAWSLAIARWAADPASSGRRPSSAGL